MATASVIFTTASTGIQSFSCPITGRIRSAYSGVSQTGGAAVSFSGTSLANGVQGGGRDLICMIGSGNQVVVDLDHEVLSGQSIYVDVKAAGSFCFVIEPIWPTSSQELS